MLSDLEKRLFESEKERTVIRREREELSKEIKDLE
jgi:hypothetical protein